MKTVTNQKCFFRMILVTTLLLMGVGLFDLAYGQIVNPSSYEKLRFETDLAIKNKVNPLLDRYCGDNCQLIKVELEIVEAISDGEDLGFESVSDEEANNVFYVNKADVKVQVDERVTTINRERLKSVLHNHLASLGFTTAVSWVPVQLPQIGKLDATANKLKKHLSNRLTRTINSSITKYCPEDCLLSNVNVEGELVTSDQAKGLDTSEIVRIPSSQTLFKVDQVTVDMEFNEEMSPENRAKVLNVIKAKTRYASPIDFRENISQFPQTYAKKRSLEKQEANDPYGLEKLRHMLVMFRDLAGTKEVITTNTSSSRLDSKDSSMEVRTNDSKQTLTESATTATKSLEGEKNAQWIDGVPNWIVMLAGIAFLFMIVGAVLLRFINAKKDADYMMHAMGSGPAGERGQGAGDSVGGEQKISIERAASSQFDAGDISLKLNVDEIKQELVDIFMKSPKVAKETFSRMLHDEGVEAASKYVHIFGHMIVFELLGDPNLSRDLFELSEFYHKSEFNFTLEEEQSLLLALRTKVTANEIKVMTRKTMDQFDFILKLDPNQIYNLVSDEKPTVQSIILTQLDHKRRRTVFEMFEGQNKVNLMRELCQADAIPKEYLANVAKALHKKVQSKPEFDAENLRSADILLELLEKSSIAEQKALMQNLQETNKDASRAIKLKLVTIEMLPYLKAGHLLEIVLGLGMEEMVTFLAGTKDHIRDLLLSHAPEELAESWIEELEVLRGVDEDRYQLVEMKILGRIRNLASNGAINLLDINDLIFSQDQVLNEEGVEVEEALNPPHMVA